MKGKVTGVAAAAQDRVQVSFDAELLGAPVEMTVDLVVLATGMVPNSADGPGIRALRDANAKLARNESETQRKEAEAAIEQLKCHEGTEILDLNYRQGPDLPVLARRIPRFEIRLLPLREHADRHLRGGRGSRAHGRGADAKRMPAARR